MSDSENTAVFVSEEDIERVGKVLRDEHEPLVLRCWC
jgi:hypothetical protein